MPSTSDKWKLRLSFILAAWAAYSSAALSQIATEPTVDHQNPDTQAAATNTAAAQASPPENLQPRQTPPSTGAAATTIQLGPVIVTEHPSYDTGQLENVIIPKFVRSHGVPTMIGQLARWRQAICPITNGLSPSSNAYVTARITEIAESVGAPIEKDCDSNVQISFTTEPQQLLDAYAKHASGLLGYHYVSQTQQLATIQHPVQAWYATATQGVRGLPIADAVVGSTANENNILEMGSGVQGLPGSRLTSEISGEFMHVLIIVDFNKMLGHELGPVADYIAMLALSQPQSLEECSELPSILDLWSSACGTRAKPTALTTADTAYLKALYRINIQDILSLQRSELSVGMRDELKAGK